LTTVTITSNKNKTIASNSISIIFAITIAIAIGSSSDSAEGIAATASEEPVIDQQYGHRQQRAKASSQPREANTNTAVRRE
jgi:hypothetical protein